MDKLGLASAAAQAPGYKALVCVFLFGRQRLEQHGDPDHATTRSTCGATALSTGINIPQASLLPITPANAGGAVYGLHPAMPELQNLFNVGKCAILCNVGSLSEPITRAQYISSKHGGKKVPDNLFSHSDQQQQFMTAIDNATLGQDHGLGRAPRRR